MSKGGYKIFDQGGLYYVSFVPMAIGIAWVDIFTRKEYRDIVIESLQHCQQEKGLVIYGWCIIE